MAFFDFLRDIVTQSDLGNILQDDQQFPAEWNTDQMPTGLLFSVLEQRQFSSTRNREGVFGGSVGQEYRANFMMPSVDIGEETNHQYSQESLSFLAEIASGSDDVVGASMGAIMRQIQQSGAGTDLARARGELADSQSVSIYTGTDTRSKTFSWTLFPSSPSDINAIVEIQGLIKKWSAPSINNRIVKIPPAWSVQEIFMDPATQETRKLPEYRFGPANITNYSFNMSPDKMWKMFRTGDPIQFEISISLQEVYINSREDIERYGL